MGRFIPSAIFLTCCMCVGISFAQLPTATILGIVRDSSGAVVPKASLTARNVETGQVRTTVSSGDGTYRFAAMPVGSYEIRVEQQGFQTGIRGGLTLAVGQEAVVDFTLELGAVEQTVAVMAEAPLVNTTSGTLGGLVAQDTVSDLPLNGRNYMDLTLLQTGISQHKNFSMAGAEAGTMFSSNGATLHSNSFLLDGAIMHSWFGVGAASLSNSTLGVEGIREWRMMTSSYSAEYGLSMGGQMTIVTKSGTNNFHGSAFEYLRNSALDARNFFDYQTATNPGRLPPFKRNNFGASLGGRIKKDKTMFFVVYEAIRQRLGLTIVDNTIPAGCHGGPGATITSAACPQLGSAGSVVVVPQIAPLLALYPVPNLPATNQFTLPFSQPTSENYGQARVDHNFSANDSLFVRYTVDDTGLTVPAPTLLAAWPQFSGPETSRSQYGTVSESHVFSTSILNTARFSYSRPKLAVESPSGLIGPQYSFVAGQELGTLNIGGVSAFGPVGTAPNVKTENIFTVSDDLFYAKGRHSVKFGTLINRWDIFSGNGTNSKGSITFANLATFLAGQPTTYQAATPGSILDRMYRYWTYGFYVQDDIRLRANFTINAGLRYEFMTVPHETHGHGAALRDPQHDASTTLGAPFENPSLKNFSPRVGFAWDVKGDGKMAVRGGYGLLYDISNQAGGLSAGVGATPPFSSLSTVVVPAANPITITFPFTFPASAAGKALRIPDYHVKQPYIHQYNLTVERQLPYSMAMTLTYGGSHGVHILGVVDANPTVPRILPDGRQFWTGTDPYTNPAWQTIEWYTSGGFSLYNSLQAGLSKRLSHGVQLQSSYTWSKLMDLPQSQAITENQSTNSWSSNPSRPKTDKGPAAFDITHNFRFNAIYRLPEVKSGGNVFAKLVNGWWMSGILSLQSGYPFTPALAANRSRSRVGSAVTLLDRPDLNVGRNNGNIVSGTSTGCSGIAAGRPLGTPNLWYDPCAFTLQAPGFLGTAGRDILRGPGFANLDFSLVKDTPLRFLGEGGRLEFRSEFFNILNRANFGMPDRTVFAGTADGQAPFASSGRITNTLGTSRQIQFALKILF